MLGIPRQWALLEGLAIGPNIYHLSNSSGECSEGVRLWLAPWTLCGTCHEVSASGLVLLTQHNVGRSLQVKGSVTVGRQHGIAALAPSRAPVWQG